VDADADRRQHHAPTIMIAEKAADMIKAAWSGFWSNQ
jgi:hypothetical protein